MYLVELGVQRTAELHVLNQIGTLTLIRRDDADLVGFGSSLQQASGDLLHISCLGPAQRFPLHQCFKLFQPLTAAQNVFFTFRMS